MLISNTAFTDPRVASDFPEAEEPAVEEVLLPAVDAGVTPEAVAVLDAIFEAVLEPEDIVDIANEPGEVLGVEDDIAVPLPPE